MPRRENNEERLENIHRLRRNPDVWFPVILVTAGVLFFSDPLFSSKNFFFRDILNFHYPLHKVLIQAYACGEFPLWNPYVALGQPMLANPNYLALYPSNLLHIFLPFDYAFKMHFILHPILAGLGLYFLQRRLQIVSLAAMGGAVVYQFSGTVLSFLNLYSIVQTVAILPWAGWAFLNALDRRSLPRVMVFGSILALQIMAFEPLMLQSLFLLLGGLALLQVLQTRNRRRALLEVTHVGCAGLVFALALAAVQ